MGNEFWVFIVVICSFGLLVLAWAREHYQHYLEARRIRHSLHRLTEEILDYRAMVGPGTISAADNLTVGQIDASVLRDSGESRIEGKDVL